jgi:hypothetical protein
MVQHRPMSKILTHYELIVIEDLKVVFWYSSRFLERRISLE